MLFLTLQNIFFHLIQYYLNFLWFCHSYRLWFTFSLYWQLPIVKIALLSGILLFQLQLGTRRFLISVITRPLIWISNISGWHLIFFMTFLIRIPYCSSHRPLTHFLCHMSVNKSISRFCIRCSSKSMYSTLLYQKLQ